MVSFGCGLLFFYLRTLLTFFYFFFFVEISSWVLRHFGTSFWKRNGRKVLVGMFFFFILLFVSFKNIHLFICFYKNGLYTPWRRNGQQLWTSFESSLKLSRVSSQVGLNWALNRVKSSWYYIFFWLDSTHLDFFESGPIFPLTRLNSTRSKY
jgi:hypothetical protein